jgi:parallel beta-helix repeat protein
VKAVALPVLLLMGLVGLATGATLTVAPAGAPYTSLQDAVDHAVSGDTILLEAGRYTGPVVISSSLMVRGAGEETILTTDGTDPALSITTADVQVEGLAVQGGGSGIGIYSTGDGVDLRNIQISGWTRGIILEGVQGARITDSEIRNNGEYGVFLQGSTGTTVTRTNLRTNGVGLYLDESSNGNTFYLNTFENAQNVVTDGSGNAWNSPGTLSYTYGGLSHQHIMGNYWSDHTDSDGDADGILDTPYIIESKKGKGSIKNPKADETDPYPLAAEWEAFFPALPPITTTVPVTTVPTPGTPTPDTTVTLTLDTPVTTPTTSPGGGEATVLPPAGWPALFLLLLLLILGGSAIAWYGRFRRKDSPTDLEDSVPGEEVHPAMVSTDTVLSRPGPSTPRALSTEPYFPPELQDRYSQIAYAGKGGIARVFRAQRKSDGRTVAVKIPISFDEDTGRAFLKEMRVWEELHHPNIVEVTAVNILPIPFVEMEYFERSLDRCHKPLDLATAVRIIRGIAGGLSYAHQKGVIHRDLKPQNILLAPDLTPKITDWGLSRQLSQETMASMTGFSLPYASPEQLSPRQFGSTGPWTDIYQLGVLLYELLYGSLPFAGEGVYETGTAIISAPPLPPSDATPEAASIWPVLLRCLEKEPQQRYASAEAFLEDLNAHLGTEIS